MKAEKFKKIFSGLDRAFGEYRYTKVEEDGKRGGNMFTKHETPTLKHFENHLNGNEPALGIIPITDDATSVWGCIDIDTYPLDHKSILKKIRSFKLPLVMCASKSFGAHIFLFSKKPQSSSLFRQKLMEIRSYLGYSKAEVFPKQEKLANDKDTGSWLNLPYFGDSRWAFLDNGEGATLEEFLELYDKYVVDDVTKVKIEIKKEVFPDGPPCLQILSTQGFPKGTRNMGVFNVGIYYRKADPDNWEQLLEKYNIEYCDPPLNTSQMTTLIKQVSTDKDGKAKYSYRCSEEPIASFCRRGVCKTRKFGKHQSGQDHPNYSDLSVLGKDPATWFLNIDAQRVELDDLDLLYSHRLLRKEIGRQLRIFVPKMKEQDWEEVLPVLFDNIKIDEGPEEMSKVGEFLDYLKEFCLNRGESFSIDELEMEKTFTDIENKLEFKIDGKVSEKNPTYLRLVDLSRWLETSKNFKVKRVWIVQRLKDLGGINSTVYVRKTQCRVWIIPAFERSQEEIPVPKQIKQKTVTKTDEVLGSKSDDEVPF